MWKHLSKLNRSGVQRPLALVPVPSQSAKRFSTESEKWIFKLDPSLKYTTGYLQIGHWAQYTKTFQEHHVVQFSQLTDDANPIHLDEEFAKNTPFKGRIAHGLLSGSLIGTVAAQVLPGLPSSPRLCH
uniref:MaoC-like domain-containing protein n=1 Tax=Arcella intermedia TaxID=1963864 RepID=A0A6B2LS27_9EUKA